MGTMDPTLTPTGSPTLKPTDFPTKSPSFRPTNNPTTAQPTKRPTPAGYEWGAFGQLCLANPGTYKCQTNMDKAVDVGGKLTCLKPQDCCLCSSIECGLGNIPCNTVEIGNWAAFAVRDVQIYGNEYIAAPGTVIECQGIESCRESVITSSNVLAIHCGGGRSCNNAVISVSNPKPNFSLKCSGIEACNGLKIELNLPVNPEGCANSVTLPFSKISCEKSRSCEGLEITINNEGCNKVTIESIDCIEPTSCDQAQFQLIGDIDITQCRVPLNVGGLSRCFQNMDSFKCSEPEKCMNLNQVITNPANGFVVECSDTRSCQNSNIRIELNQDVAYLKGFIFSGIQSAENAIFTIDNQQNNALRVESIKCSAYESCVGVTFITGNNVQIDKIECAGNACLGCTVKQTVSDPVGVPCELSNISPPPPF